MCLILKRARSHICFIQETNWSTVQYNHISLSSPFCSIYHSPATGEGSSGVASFLPHPLTASSHSIITPGYLLTISTSIGGLSVELINVYLHPRKLSQLGSSLLAHLRNEHSRSHDLRFIGGDLNQLNTKVPTLYQHHGYPLFHTVLLLTLTIFTKQSPHLRILRQVQNPDFPSLLGAWPLRFLPAPLLVISTTFKPNKPELLFSLWSLSPKRIKVITLRTIVRLVYQTPAIG